MTAERQTQSIRAMKATFCAFWIVLLRCMDNHGGSYRDDDDDTLGDFRSLRPARDCVDGFRSSRRARAGREAKQSRCAPARRNSTAPVRAVRFSDGLRPVTE